MDWHCLHKDQFLGEYTAAISKNTWEKFPIFEHIKKKAWIYLEVGPWSITYDKLYQEVKQSWSILYLWDVSRNILENYCTVNNITSTRHAIRPILIDLWSLPFIDSTLDGINCSAVFHEIITYDWGENLEKAIMEIMRCLKPWWIMFYRDPWLCPNYLEKCMITISLAFEYFIKLYKRFLLIDNKENVSWYQKDYLNVITNFDEELDNVQITLKNLYELKRHFILFTINVFWEGALEDENKLEQLFHWLYNEVMDVKYQYWEKANNRFLREGYELYYYFDTEQFLIYILEVCLNNDSMFILFPIDSSKIQYINRNHYNSFITKHLKTKNIISGKDEAIIEWKSIVHFSKIAKESAYWYIIHICSKLWYTKLRHFTEQNIWKFYKNTNHATYLDF